METRRHPRQRRFFYTEFSEVMTELTKALNPGKELDPEIPELTARSLLDPPRANRGAVSLSSISMVESSVITSLNSVQTCADEPPARTSPASSPGRATMETRRHPATDERFTQSLVKLTELTKALNSGKELDPEIPELAGRSLLDRSAPTASARSIVVVKWYDRNLRNNFTKLCANLRRPAARTNTTRVVTRPRNHETRRHPATDEGFTRSLAKL